MLIARLSVAARQAMSYILQNYTNMPKRICTQVNLTIEPFNIVFFVLYFVELIKVSQRLKRFRS